ncbi:hypothetical protein [Methanocella conradii]|uniref:hypothetical protein n=1 Tax=Methanocella conradii TaxID=1175444 RepID=UPI00157BF218|nr:hypothetical protein [Methanocella conradii]
MTKNGNKYVTNIYSSGITSINVSTLSPLGLGGAIGGLIWYRLGGGYVGVLGTVIGVIIGQLLSGPTCNILMDESIVFGSGMESRLDLKHFI